MSSRAFQLRCLLLCSVLVTGLSLLSVRLISIQLWDRQTLAARASAAYDRTEVIPGLRGKIVDRHEEVLAKSIPVSTVMINRYHIEDPKLAAFALAHDKVSREEGWEALDPSARRRRVFAERSVIIDKLDRRVILERHLAHAIGLLARPLGMRREELRERIEGPRGKYFPIAKDIPEDVADDLRELIDRHWLQGFEFENSVKRWYTAPDLATHVVGYTSEAERIDAAGDKVFRQVGVFGVEAALEDYLAGRDGWRKHRRDARGMLMPGGDGSLCPPSHGLNVKLTLDTGVQAIIEEELDRALEEYESKRGCVIVLDPSNGEILGMVNRPHFNLNRKEGLAEGAMNYALQGIYEPGSTFKVVAAAGALNEGLVSPTTEVFCHHGVLREGKLRVPDHHPYGMLSVEGVLIKSSNIGAFKIARQLGAKRFYDYAADFGFGQETGILLSGESAGIVRNTNNLIDFSRASYGYALNVTPLQVASAYGAIANGGELIRPSIVRSVIASDGSVIERFRPQVVRRVMKERVSRQMRDALTKVTETGGTATRAEVEGFKVAGKTGTAKRVYWGRYQEGHYTVSFAGMMPAQDPAFVCLVVIDDPLTDKVKRYGGTIAAPTFAKIAGRLATHLDLEPTEPIEEETEGALAGTTEP